MGNELSEHSFQLRLAATVITEKICQTALGINVLRYGTMLFDANGTYQYDVEAACSGLRSLTVMLAMNTVVAFLVFKTWWRRGAMILMAVPLATAANVLRLSSIVIAGETFGQKAGNTVHDSWWMSLIPYVLAFGGAILMRRWLAEERADAPPPAADGVVELRQGS